MQQQQQHPVSTELVIYQRDRLLTGLGAGRGEGVGDCALSRGHSDLGSVGHNVGGRGSRDGVSDDGGACGIRQGHGRGRRDSLDSVDRLGAHGRDAVKLRAHDIGRDGSDSSEQHNVRRGTHLDDFGRASPKGVCALEKNVVAVRNECSRVRTS